MDITFLGHAAFRIKGKAASLVTDPSDPKVTGLKFPKVSADIVTVSHTQHSDHKSVELISDVKRVVSGPGEYEISDISIIGISSFHDDKKGALRGKNTMYVFEVDGVRIAHLGDLGHKLKDKDLEALGDIDVLMIPVGGVYTIDAKIAAEIVRDIEPRIILPMHYFLEGMNKDVFEKLERVDAFLSEVGLPNKKMDKLTLKGEIIEDQRIVVLQKK